MTSPHDAQSLHDVSTLLGTLTATLKTLRLYGEQHPRLIAQVNEYRRRCQVVVDRGDIISGRLIIARAAGRYYLENMPLPETALSLDYFGEQLDRHRQRGFEIDITLTDDRLLTVLHYLELVRRKIANGDDPPPGFRWLTDRELEHLEGSSPGAARAEVETAADESKGGCPLELLFAIPELRVSSDLYSSAIERLSQFMDESQAAKNGQIAPILGVANDLVARLITSSSQFVPLTTVPYYDVSTYQHSVNVCILSLMMARHLVDSDEQLQRIGQAALLHDLGKARIPRAVLNKNGRLTDDEMQLIMRHPADGARMLSEFPEVDPLHVAVAFGHHIKDNGAGYPKVQQSYVLGAATRLVEVADIFEALTAHRPYKKPLTAAQAFEILFNMPNMQSFVPYMQLLLKSLGYEPVGSRVRTSSGELGIVCGHHENDPAQPIVQILEPPATGDSKWVVGVSAASPNENQDPARVKIMAIDPEQELVPAR
ncbi:MAG: HD-GYP domain-containing protein [Planctomycetota bacterium]